MAHSDAPLTSQIDNIYRYFRRLRSKSVWKNHVAGGASFLEITRNDTRGTWHVHIHTIAAARFIPVLDYANKRKGGKATLPGLRETWRSVTGGSFVVHCSSVRDRDAAAAEVSKYVTKPLSAALFADPDALDEFVSAIKGRRLCLTFGTWYKIRLTAPLGTYNPADWIRECRLDDLLARYEAGEVYASYLLEWLREDSPCRPIPPPASARLFP